LLGKETIIDHAGAAPLAAEMGHFRTHALKMRTIWSIGRRGFGMQNIQTVLDGSAVSASTTIEQIIS
jgi:hypothetical protein